MRLVTAERTTGAWSQVTSVSSGLWTVMGTRVKPITAASNGAVAVSASAMDDHGNVSPVIFWINSEGSINRIVRTAPFAASRIVFASDGSLWAAGRVYTIAGSKIVAAAQYDVLRRYNSQGNFSKQPSLTHRLTTFLQTRRLGLSSPAAQIESASSRLMERNTSSFQFPENSRVVGPLVPSCPRTKWVVWRSLPPVRCL